VGIAHAASDPSFAMPAVGLPAQSSITGTPDTERANGDLVCGACNRDLEDTALKSAMQPGVSVEESKPGFQMRGSPDSAVRNEKMGSGQEVRYPLLIVPTESQAHLCSRDIVWGEVVEAAGVGLRLRIDNRKLIDSSLCWIR
jgi:hypothetical protein